MAEQRVPLEDVPKLLNDLLVFHEYPAKALRTAKPLSFEDTLMHAGLLITSEAGEIADAIKKHLVYGKDLDKANLLEEIGDACWGLNLLLDALGFTWKQALEANITKLEKRYPGNTYSQDNAINRDKVAEAKVFNNTKVRIDRIGLPSFYVEYPENEVQLDLFYDSHGTSYCTDTDSYDLKFGVKDV